MPGYGYKVLVLRGRVATLRPSTCTGTIAFDDAEALRRISMTLHRWHELECSFANFRYYLIGHFDPKNIAYCAPIIRNKSNFREPLTFLPKIRELTRV